MRAQRGALARRAGSRRSKTPPLGSAAGVGGRVDERAQRRRELVEQRAHLGGRHARLVVVEQHVVGVRGVREAGGVPAAQLDLAGERGRGSGAKSPASRASIQAC